jgi:hypothetical protein
LINPETEIDSKDPEMELVRIDKVKDQIRKQKNLQASELEEIQKLENFLPK